MKDRTKLANGRSSKLMCPADYAPADFATFLADLKLGNVYVDVTANNSTGADAGVTEVGTPLNKANILTDATALGFGFDAQDNPTINDVFARIGADYITGTLAIGETTLVLSDERIKATSLYDVYTDKYGIQAYDATVANGSLTLYFSAQEVAINVKVRVF